MSSSDNMSGGMYIALAAPRGVGKTSVITALLEEANDILAGTRVSVEATGETRRRLNKLQNQLRGHLRAKEFVPDGIGGTQDMAQFSLEIGQVNTDRKFKLEVLDYPGGLLESQEGEQWKHVKGWFKQAEVLVLPIDATLLMEATTVRHHHLAEDLLNLEEIKSIAARQWAKQRTAARLGPGLLVLAPVKGETYFSDNGGTSNRADELLERVSAVYRHVIEAVRKESPGVTVMYCPIDTIGCVEVMRLVWPSRDATDGRPVAHYKVRGDAQLCRKGAADLFVAIVTRILGAASERQGANTQEAIYKAKIARENANKEQGPLDTFWDWISGETKRLKNDLNSKDQCVDVEVAALNDLQRTLEDVKKRPMSARVRFIEG